MRVRGVGRRASDAERAIRRMHVISATHSMMVTVPEFRRRVCGSGDDRRTAARPGVSIRTIVARGATASVECTMKHRLLTACQLKNKMLVIFKVERVGSTSCYCYFRWRASAATAV